MLRRGDPGHLILLICKSLLSTLETGVISCFDTDMSFLSILTGPLTRKLNPKAAPASLATTDQPKNREVS
jgi:hypothetical protein